MKKILLIAVALLSLSATAVELWPNGHSMCLNQRGELCSEGTELLYADGGCGCLQASDYWPAAFCRRANIRCEEGTEFSQVQQKSSSSPNATPTTVGCGCFSIFQGMIPLGNR